MTTETPTTPNEPMRLPTTYAPADIEGPLYERWVERGYFAPADEGTPYSIVIPPPNVTGSLHVGHALDHTIQDILIRRHRMQGYATLWLPGTDHAGIATQNVVERELAKEGKSRHDLGREGFEQRVWEWKAQSGGKILGQMRRLGDSVDWSRERFTMDEQLSRAVLTMFARLYDEGLIYRAERIINWCPRCLTALSDIEVEHSDDEGELVSLRYGSEDEGTIVVATTRAETMLGDTGIAVHPDDERYRHLIGRELTLPLTDRKIPVVADDSVDPSFGSGAVKVTPAHDPNDFEIGQRHGLPTIAMMNEHAVVTVPGPFEGLDRFEARPAVVAALREAGRVVAQKRPYVHAVGHCQRCETVVEPRVSLQWFVKVEPLAAAASTAVREGRIRIHPEDMSKRWYSWVDNMHDWCISRQLWWGHRIPVWYGPDGETVCVGPDDQPPSGEGWTQDPDVLDTWFSSGQWPMTTLGWPDDSSDLARFYPTSVLVTGYDILFFWVARMAMLGLYGMHGEVPFHQVVLHGMVRDQFGRKMSKSLGNAVDPLDWIDRYGADATRFTLARGANPGSDVPVSDEWAAGSRNFCTKLWNATRFALMNGAKIGELPPSEQLSTTDQWILSRLHRLLAEADEFYDEYEFAKACEAIQAFAWNEFCDWYVELAKPSLNAGGDVAECTRLVLGHVLDKLLKVLHPVMPFVTEALWTEVTGGESVVVAAWPAAQAGFADPEAEAEIESLRRLVTEVRRFRSDQGLKPGQRVPARLAGLAEGRLTAHEPGIRMLLRLDEPNDNEFSPTASLEVENVTVQLDTAGTIDVAAERKRLEKDLATARKEKEQAEKKLGNEQFLAKAPEQVVAEIRARRETAEVDLARLEKQLSALPS